MDCSSGLKTLHFPAKVLLQQAKFSSDTGVTQLTHSQTGSQLFHLFQCERSDEIKLSSVNHSSAPYTAIFFYPEPKIESIINKVITTVWKGLFN